LVDARNLPTVGQRGLQCSGRLPGEHGQRMLLKPHCALERRDLRRGLLAFGARLLDVHRRGKPGLHAPACELQRFVLQRQVGARDRQPRLLAAQVDVGERDLGGQRHLHVGQFGLCGTHIRFRRLDGAAQPAEHVDLPARVESGLEDVAGAGIAGPGALRGGRRIGERQQAGSLHVALRAHPCERRVRAEYAGVGLERLRDQRGHLRVVEVLPPGGERRGWRRRDAGRRPARRHRHGGQRAVTHGRRGAAGQQGHDGGSRDGTRGADNGAGGDMREQKANGFVAHRTGSVPTPSVKNLASGATFCKSDRSELRLDLVDTRHMAAPGTGRSGSQVQWHLSPHPVGRWKRPVRPACPGAQASSPFGGSLPVPVTSG